MNPSFSAITIVVMTVIGIAAVVVSSLPAAIELDAHVYDSNGAEVKRSGSTSVSPDGDDSLDELFGAEPAESILKPTAPRSHDNYDDGIKVSFLRRRLPAGGWDPVNREMNPTYPEDKRDSTVVTMTASPSPFCIANGTITVSWSGVSSPYSNDTLVLFSPADSNDTDWLDYFPVNEANGWSSGSGVLNFTLLNMRTSYQFRYYSGSNNVVIGYSNIVQVCPMPLQGHLSLTNIVSEMRIMFVTPDIEGDSAPIAMYGLSPDALNSVVSGVTDTYTADMICAEPANITGARLFRDPGMIHDVVMSGLQPDTTYYYRFGTSAAGMSDTLSFRSAPVVSPTTDVKFIVYGDMGEGYLVPEAAQTATRVMGELTNGDINFVLHVGDISYARSVGYSWEWYGTLIAGIATQVPYMLGTGNHEYDHIAGGENDPSNPGDNNAGGIAGWHPSWGNFGDDSHGECGRPLYERFHMPDNGNSLFWYSFDYGSVHIVMMSSEHDWTPGSPQYQWIAQDLASVDRTRTPWLLIGSHRPMYTSENYESDYQVSLYLQAAMESLWAQHKIDMALTGHYHAYERTCSVFNQTCQEAGSPQWGITHIVVGTAGFELDQTTWMGKVWSVNHAIEFGYGRVSVSSDVQAGTTTLLYEFVFNANGTVYDSVSITKPLP